jgi:hypothetical protein
MATHEHYDPFAPIQSADLPALSGASGDLPAGPNLPHHLMGALAPIDPSDPFAGVNAVVGRNAFGVQAFDHASALNDNPFTATGTGDDRPATPANRSGNPLATIVSAGGGSTSDPFA